MRSVYLAQLTFAEVIGALSAPTLTAAQVLSLPENFTVLSAVQPERKEKTENDGRRKFIKNKAWSKQKAKKEKKKKLNEKRKREEVKMAIFKIKYLEFCTNLTEV